MGCCTYVGDSKDTEGFHRAIKLNLERQSQELEKIICGLWRLYKTWNCECERKVKNENQVTDFSKCSE